MKEASYGKKKKVFIYSVLVIICLIGIAYVGTRNTRKYSKANQLLNENQFKEAAEVFRGLKGYKEADILYQECMFQQANELLENKEYDSAIEIFDKLDNYDNSKNKVKECKYGMANDLLEENQFEKSKKIYEQIKDFKDTDEKLKICNYNLGKKEFESKNYLEASDLFLETIGYDDAEDKYNESIYHYAKSLVKQYNYSEAEQYFEMIEYEDSKELAERYKLFDDTRYIDGRFYYTPEEFALLLTENLSAGLEAKYVNAEESDDLIELYENGVKTQINILLGGVSSEQDSFTEVSLLHSDFRENLELLIEIAVSIVHLTNPTLEYNECENLATTLVNTSELNKDGIRYTRTYNAKEASMKVEVGSFD